MLARVSRSACMPAPLLGSEAAKTSTAGGAGRGRRSLEFKVDPGRCTLYDPASPSARIEQATNAKD